MNYKLQDVCELISESASYECASFDDYVSTENMIRDKGGITSPSSIPVRGSVRKYKKDDVLVSNIRPYFKKIWYADRDGTCSNDVLVFRAGANCSPYFLYCVLSDDLFFQYMTSTSKGTKMPRGDRDAIMKYGVNLPDAETQYEIERIIGSIEDLITCNFAINDYLLETSETIFEQHCPYTIEDELPPGWSISTLDDISESHNFKRIPLAKNIRDDMKKIYPYYGAASLIDFVEDFIFDGEYILLGEDGTVSTPEGKPILQYVFGKFWVNNHAHILTGKNKISTELLMMFLKNLDVSKIITGAVQPKINQRNLKSLKLVLPPYEVIDTLNKKISLLFSQYRVNMVMNSTLRLLRNSLIFQLIYRNK